MFIPSFLKRIINQIKLFIIIISKADNFPLQMTILKLFNLLLGPSHRQITLINNLPKGVPETFLSNEDMMHYKSNHQ